MWMVEMGGEKGYFDLGFWDCAARSLESWIQSEASQAVVIEASLMLGLQVCNAWLWPTTGAEWLIVSSHDGGNEGVVVIVIHTYTQKQARTHTDWPISEYSYVHVRVCACSQPRHTGSLHRPHGHSATVAH